MLNRIKLLFNNIVKPYIYDGEYRNGKYEGIGKLYKNNGILIYEGEFKAGRYNGHGKLYDESSSLSFEGEFKNGSISGYGVKYSEGAKPNTLVI